MNVYIKKQSFFWRNILIKIGIVVFLIIFLNLFQSQVKNIFYMATSPVSQVFLHAGNNTNNFFNSIFSFNSIKKENENLRQENNNLLTQIAQLNSVVIQNQAVSQFLQNTPIVNFSALPAKAIGLDIATDTIAIDKGLIDGIQENMPVISSQNVLYGKISKVYKNFSEVALISTTKNAVAVKIQNSNSIQENINGVIRGDSHGKIYLDLVNSDSEIKAGDDLITSGLEGIFPRDLLVGKITNVSQNDAKVFQTATVKPAFDFNNIDNLFIITNYKTK